MVRLFDPDDVITPVGLHDRHVRSDGQGAALWLEGLHAEGVALGFQGIRGVDTPPGPHGPDSDPVDLPRMAVVAGSEMVDIPALRGGVSSVDGRIFKLRGTYTVRVIDPSAAVSCSVEFLDFELSLELRLDGLR